jgi:uncharacterized protein
MSTISFFAPPPTQVLDAKEAALRDLLRGLGRVVVAFSGGVDSAYLLSIAREVLGDDARAVIGVSPSLMDEEYEEARELAAKIGAPLREVETLEIENEDYASNPTNRCYFCKSELFDVLGAIARSEDFGVVCDGTNVDDLREWRPGAQAGSEKDVRSPLREVGLGKDEIRALSRRRGLESWDKPAMPCLASRIPHGTPVTREALKMIGAGEAFLRQRGLREVRVRHYVEGDKPQARLEIAPHEIARVFDFYEELTAHLKELGYAQVLLDLEGYKRGKLTEHLLEK